MKKTGIVSIPVTGLIFAFLTIIYFCKKPGINLSVAITISLFALLWSIFRAIKTSGKGFSKNASNLKNGNHFVAHHFIQGEKGVDVKLNNRWCYFLSREISQNILNHADELEGVEVEWNNGLLSLSN